MKFLTLNAVSARAMREDLKSKTGLARSKQAKDFDQRTKEILDLAKVTFTHAHSTELSLTVQFCRRPRTVVLRA